ncbi:MAG TPA: apolipoprotein N-acyltransferase [Spirochaetota bacterium]|nr:apolipoprotein N-acyltransferase [Spirochaetota bacterium]HPF06093.1 apolipoprotein N-acyltransferase [Spirochaetota bacterium]HRX47347.1 apolipoprotein N-acyltransferase [Spirochaetota bacterium]
MFLLYPLLTALLFIASFPFNISAYIAFISFVPWFTSIALQTEIKKTAASGALFGLLISIYFSKPLYHSIMTGSPDNPLLPVFLIICTVILPNVIIYCIYAISLRWINTKHTYQRALFPASAWIIIDYFKELSSFMLPWGFAGYTQVYTPFIQIADITGIYGITFLIILINTTITELIIIIRQHVLLNNVSKIEADASALKSKLRKLLFLKSFSYNIILLLIIIISVFTYGIFKKNNVIASFHNYEKVKYLIIQGNTESIDRWNESTSASRYQSYIQLTEKKISDSDFTVWPETVLNSSDKTNFEIMSGISANLNDSGFFISGGIRRDNDDNTYNSIFVMKKQKLEYIYDKKILFPYSERSFFGTSGGAFLNSPAKFSRGDTKSVYKTGKILTGFSICFESIYPSVIRKQSRSGAALLVNVANDSWFGNSSVPYLQKYAVISRAIENRISIIRSSNSGISFAVTPAGEAVSIIPLNTRNTAYGSLPVIAKRSFYSKTGDWIIIVAILFLLITIVTREIDKQKY